MSVQMTRPKATCEPWPDEQTARLRKLIADRLTASAIASELGLAKGAVSGKARRLGLSIIGGPQPPTPAQIAQREAAKAVRDAEAARLRALRPAKPKPAPRQKRVVRAQARVFGETKVKPAYVVSSNGAVIERAPDQVPRAPLKARAFMPLPGCAPVPFGSSGCRWPIDGHAEPMACGAAKAATGPYCSTHATMSASKWQPAAGQPVDPLKWAARR